MRIKIFRKLMLFRVTVVNCNHWMIKGRADMYHLRSQAFQDHGASTEPQDSNTYTKQKNKFAAGRYELGGDIAWANRHIGSAQKLRR